MDWNAPPSVLVLLADVIVLIFIIGSMTALLVKLIGQKTQIIIKHNGEQSAFTNKQISKLEGEILELRLQLDQLANNATWEPDNSPDMESDNKDE